MGAPSLESPAEGLFFRRDDVAAVAEEHHRAVSGADRGTRSLEGGPVPQLAGEHQPQALHL